MIKNLLLVLAIGVVLYQFFAGQIMDKPGLLTADASHSEANALDKAFQARRSDVQVGGSGKVLKVLRDDTQGSRHQKFILRLSSGQTLLVAHNIDLAPRINALQVGDTIEFYGEYEWNERGGVLHWTHHDPGGRHIDGWLKHQGVIYQ